MKKGKRTMKNNTTIIGIDHGFGLIKTVNTDFVSGVKCFGAEEPPLPDKTICLDQQYYFVGGKRMHVMSDKTADNKYYILTLAALVEEMKLRKRKNDSIILAAGLPIERMGKEKENFKKYLLQNKKIDFSYEGNVYHVNIEDAYIYPQGYAAIVSSLSSMSGTHILVDVGSWTIDILPIVDRVPDTSRCLSLNMGVITCMTSINNEMRRKYNSELEESQIQDIMRGGTGQLQEKFLTVAKEVISEYTDNVLAKLWEIGFNLEVTPVIFMGGGAVVMEEHGNYDKVMTTFLTDIHANAKGYEFITKQKLSK